ncbi:hypothetical protein ABVT39_012193 [Epinephelus coioides]
MWSLLLPSLSPQSPRPCGARLSITCRQKGIHLVSMFTKHNEPVCIFGYTVAALKAKNMVIAECSVSCRSIVAISFKPKYASVAFLATHQHLQSCTLCLKESCRAQPVTARGTANSQHLVQAGAVRSIAMIVVSLWWTLLGSLWHQTVEESPPSCSKQNGRRANCFISARWTIDACSRSPVI